MGGGRCPPARNLLVINFLKGSNLAHLWPRVQRIWKIQSRLETVAKERARARFLATVSSRDCSTGQSQSYLRILVKWVWYVNECNQWGYFTSLFFALRNSNLCFGQWLILKIAIFLIFDANTCSWGDWNNSSPRRNTVHNFLTANNRRTVSSWHYRLCLTLRLRVLSIIFDRDCILQTTSQILFSEHFLDTTTTPDISWMTSQQQLIYENLVKIC